MCFELVKVRKKYWRVFPWWCFVLLDLLWEALLGGGGGRRVGGELREAALMGKPGHTLTLVFFFNHHSLFLSNRPHSVKSFGVVFLYCYIWIILKLLLVECIISVDQPRCHCRLNLRAQVLNKVMKWREGQVKECELHSVHKRPLSEAIKAWDLGLHIPVFKYISSYRIVQAA